MTPREIIKELEDGKPVEIRTRDAMEFMRRVERFHLTSLVINVSVDGPKTTLRVDGQTTEEAQTMKCQRCET